MKLNQLLEEIVKKYKREFPSKFYKSNEFPIYKLSEKDYRKDINEILSSYTRPEREFRFIADVKTKSVYAFSIDITHFQASRALGFDYDSGQFIEGFGKVGNLNITSIDTEVKKYPWLNKFIKYEEY
jgi:hypothetical protein